VQVTLRMTVPGVPDLYQGRERWDFSLVDPDNRTPVDFSALTSTRMEGVPLTSSLDSWRNGRLKQALIARLLEARRLHPDLFAHGDYEPIEVTGSRAAHVLAFRRKSERHETIVAAILHSAKVLANAREIVPPSDWWDDTALAQDGRDDVEFRDVLSDTGSAEFPLLAATLFETLPVAVLVSTAT